MWIAEARLRKRKREDFVDKSDDSGSDDDVSHRAIEEWKSAAGFSTRSKRTNKSKVCRLVDLLSMSVHIGTWLVFFLKKKKSAGI